MAFVIVGDRRSSSNSTKCSPTCTWCIVFICWERTTLSTGSLHRIEIGFVEIRCFTEPIAPRCTSVNHQKSTQCIIGVCLLSQFETLNAARCTYSREPNTFRFSRISILSRSCTIDPFHQVNSFHAEQIIIILAESEFRIWIFLRFSSNAFLFNFTICSVKSRAMSCASHKWIYCFCQFTWDLLSHSHKFMAPSTCGRC